MTDARCVRLLAMLSWAFAVLETLGGVPGRRGAGGHCQRLRETRSGVCNLVCMGHARETLDELPGYVWAGGAPGAIVSVCMLSLQS